MSIALSLTLFIHLHGVKDAPPPVHNHEKIKLS